MRRRRHDFGYFFHEGLTNMFSHGFMSFAAIATTVACLVIMGTFALVAYNADVELKKLQDENEILAFVDDSYSEEQARALESTLLAIDNVASCTFITRAEATEVFEARYEGEQMLQGLDASILRDRFTVRVYDLERQSETAEALRGVTGIANVRADEDLAKGFVALRNIAGVVCLALIAILLLVSVLIISNTIKLTTFDRRDEIAIMKMVGATNGFIRWPFVYEGFLLGLLSAVLAFALQWLLYAAVAKSVDMSDVLQLLDIVPFADIWKPVATVFGAAGMVIGVGGSLTAIRKFLQV